MAIMHMKHPDQTYSYVLCEMPRAIYTEDPKQVTCKKCLALLKG